jgi:hypothetical protein
VNPGVVVAAVAVAVVVVVLLGYSAHGFVSALLH